MAFREYFEEDPVSVLVQVLGLSAATGVAAWLTSLM